ncbi:MarR family transcriptional regulator [Erythrobacter sp. F6033]|uniref:MarR family winged helix-turn-helix transcriptional regulator n=1 Tax=Erythrobacter sp. F6033 TaxID=2926401 RepID=UPI001FF45136|nr:MarR family transcriptional regulator [Erythrobacter sp. F6033]MCK0129461.1 MarR family transcriptional regulator [Erythrobacter sp. F6033]
MDSTVNLLGALGLAVADRIQASALDILHRAGETPAALVVIGYGFGLSNDRLGKVLQLSHPGTVRLIDRLVADNLVERRSGSDKRSNALYLTDAGMEKREELLKGRLLAIRPLVESLADEERDMLDDLLRKVLKSASDDDLGRRRICRMCDSEKCANCPIPADFKSSE